MQPIQQPEPTIEFAAGAGFSAHGVPKYKRPRCTFPAHNAVAVTSIEHIPVCVLVILRDHFYTAKRQGEPGKPSDLCDILAHLVGAEDTNGVAVERSERRDVRLL
ncbi:hypothetical protein WK07_22615 [Burkholderia multivorans]|nr:hypothetical protein WK07_22615 [Burkholderia multivorans]